MNILEEVVEMCKKQTGWESVYLGASYNIEASTAGQALLPYPHQGLNQHCLQVLHGQRWVL